MNLATMRTQVAQALMDTGFATYSANDIDRAIKSAVDRYSLVAPEEKKLTIATTNASRVIPNATITNVVWIEAVEYLVDKYPRIYQPFSYYAGVLEVIGADVPDGSDCYVYYGKKYDPDAATWTIPVHHERVIQMGAEAYAVVAFGSKTTISAVTTTTTAREAAAAAFKTGLQRMAMFEKELASIASRLRSRNLYSPALPPKSKTTDPGP